MSDINEPNNPTECERTSIMCFMPCEECEHEWNRRIERDKRKREEATRE